MTKICNIMTKRPSSLYTEPRERRLPKTHIHIVNKQILSFSTTIIHHLCFLHHHLPQLFNHPNDDYNVATPRHQPHPRRTTTNGKNLPRHHAPLRWFEDDLARQQTCHVVQTVTTQIIVTVHMNSGKPLLSLFPLFT